ncbi:MAG: rhomboid family intramembrane serine protease [Deltaproteobacteria bacterium]|nr:rhomboid family intramembrane serine protease [Deltaproteobacteria bacterium]
MIPIRDNIRSRHTPWVTWLLILANVAAFVYELRLGDGLEDFIVRYGLVPWRLTRGLEETGFRVGDHVVPWFSSMFLHGGWLHLIGNMWFLWIFGDNVEDRLGPAKYLVFYLAGGLCAGMGQLAVDPLSVIPMVGASGAIAAVLAGYVILYPTARIVTLVPLLIFFFFAEIPAFVFIGVWFLLQYLSGSAALAGSSAGDGVAWWAHIGGFVAGVPLVLALKGPRAEPRWRDRPGTVTVIRRQR